MLTPDVFWSSEQGSFNYRVAGVCVVRQHVFLQQEIGTDFWFLPGGRCQLMEPAAATLGREMEEELNTAVRVGRLLWIVENFFDLGGRPCHELGLYFHMSLPASCDVRDLDRIVIRPAREHETRCRYQWFPIGDLDEIRLYPATLQNALHRLPRTPRHLIQQG